MYDVLELTKLVEKEVCKEVDGKFWRKYYRFRATHFYGGCATADCSGCNLRCGYCWSSRVVWRNVGKFYSPEYVAKKLNEISRENNFRYCRISGGEPTLCKNHLLQVLKGIDKDLIFILETNGILLGFDECFVKELSHFKNLHVRVSLKAANPRMFEDLTKAQGKFFEFQLKALENLKKYGISFHPAILINFYTKKLLRELEEKLATIDKSLIRELEFETLILFPHVKKNIKEYKIEKYLC